MSMRDDEDTSMFIPVLLLILAIFIALAAGPTSDNIDDDVGVCTHARSQLGC